MPRSTATMLLLLLIAHCAGVEGLYRIANADHDRQLCAVVARRIERVIVRAGEYDGDRFVVMYQDMPWLRQRDFPLWKGAVCRCPQEFGWH